MLEFVGELGASERFSSSELKRVTWAATSVPEANTDESR
jgi:hypothetical protein